MRRPATSEIGVSLSVGSNPAFPVNRRIAQLVEREILTPVVTGSIPVVPNSLSN